jgi:5-methylcytosine-specific restriction endonuclease McrA
MNKEKKRIYDSAYRAQNKEKIRARLVKYNIANADKISLSRKAFYEANREVVLARNAAYVRANLNKTRSSAAAYQKSHPEQKKVNQAKYRLNNADKLRAASAKYRLENSEKVRVRHIRYSEANPEVRSRNRQKRRALIRNATVGNLDTIEAWERSWRKKKRTVCYWCSTRFSVKKCQVDHINPLAKGGAHTIENLCISCARCNASKCAKELGDWNKRIQQPVML